ncbi:MAG: hypothetical protein DHS20C18_08820 [Saprospiraceae bacterium]|nr:MAG: hypothetical protein DHS20C18_08820 [Saprospiraceae bacterium]
MDKVRKKIERYRRESWPPIKSHSRLSLGYALQKIFRNHCDFCGFDVSDTKRDYVPRDIEKFLGRRTLRTRVEMADIRGGGLMNYIFDRREIEAPFDEIKYLPNRILKIDGLPDQFTVNADENFDAFVLTKNCSGYLKAALDAGIEPPYAAFKTALDTDDRRESTVMAVSGSFVSPMRLILEANDSRTISAMMTLWKFYTEHPNLINNAFYLKGFEGVLVKQETVAEENFRIESQVGININGPLAAHLKASFGAGSSTRGNFAGTNWETLIFTDFENYYQRPSLYAPLPSPESIGRYFETLKPTFQKAHDFPLMTEGTLHQHYLIIEGIPQEMTQNFWVLENVTPGVYDSKPHLDAEYFQQDDGTYGCRFTVSGRPAATHFRGPLAERPGKVNLSYRIRSRKSLGGHYLRFLINEEVQTSAHPVASVGEGRFDLSIQEDRRFSFQWKFGLEIEDRDNPVDFMNVPYIENLQVRSSGQTLNVKVVEILPDPQRHRFLLTLETVATYPLDKIDDRNMSNFNLSMDVHLQSLRSGLRSVRPVKGILSFPSIRPDPPAPEPEPITTEILPEVPISNGQD